jgi:hypothetical protein
MSGQSAHGSWRLPLDDKDEQDEGEHIIRSAALTALSSALDGRSAQALTATADAQFEPSSTPSARH